MKLQKPYESVTVRACGELSRAVMKPVPARHRSRSGEAGGSVRVTVTQKDEKRSPGPDLAKPDSAMINQDW